MFFLSENNIEIEKCILINVKCTYYSYEINSEKLKTFFSREFKNMYIPETISPLQGGLF